MCLFMKHIQALLITKSKNAAKLIMALNVNDPVFNIIFQMPENSQQ